MTKKKNVVHDVLDADHLVVGVDLEVVLPAVGAVARVVVHPGRASRDVVQPVVEGADPGQEAERAAVRKATTVITGQSQSGS